MASQNEGIILARQRKSLIDLLSSEGLTSANDYGNRAVRMIYGKYSKNHHMLSVLKQNHDWGTTWIKQWECPQPDAQGCRPFNSFPHKPYAKTLKGFCKTCNRRIRSRIICSRLLAIFQLRRSELWKAVLTRQYSRRSYVFEGSARCNLYGHPNHCMTPSHLSLETFRRNIVRKRHHAGLECCDCVSVCIGSGVRRDQLLLMH